MQCPPSRERGCTQHDPLWLRSIWVISSSCPEGQGRARSHCPNSVGASRVTKKSFQQWRESRKPRPSCPPRPSPMGCELGPSCRGSQHKQHPGAHSRAHRASTLTRASGSSPWRWHMGNDPFKYYLKHHSIFQHSSSHPSELVAPGWAQSPYNFH